MRREDAQRHLLLRVCALGNELARDATGREGEKRKAEVRRLLRELGRIMPLHEDAEVDADRVKALVSGKAAPRLAAAG